MALIKLTIIKQVQSSGRTSIMCSKKCSWLSERLKHEYYDEQRWTTSTGPRCWRRLRYVSSWVDLQFNPSQTLMQS